MLSRTHRHNADLSEAQQNAASVWDSPLPEGPAQLCLIALALTGHDTYVYESAARGRWYVWLGDLADVRQDKNGRVPLDEWQERYADLLAEFYTSQEGGCTDAE